MQKAEVCGVNKKNRQPTREDIVNIVSRMYEKDGISRKDVISIVDKFPNQGKQFTISNEKIHRYSSLPFLSLWQHLTSMEL